MLRFVVPPRALEAAAADDFRTGIASASLSSLMPFCSNARGSTVSLLETAGAGLPFRLFFRAPLDPEKMPPFAPSCCWLPPVRLNFSSRCFMTLRISPSFKPSVRSKVGWMSCRFSWPIWSLSKAAVYLSHICGFTPHCRKKSNQSYFGFCGSTATPRFGLGLGSGDFCAVRRCVLRLLMSDNGLSSSSETPVTRSTYSRSASDIFDTSTAI